jgi:phosphoglycolate phosphatase
MQRPRLEALDAAIIDLDGTLVDTLGDFVVALNLMLRDMGLPAVNHDVVAKLVGKGSEHLIRSVLAWTGLTDGAIAAPDGYARAWPLYQQHYQRINGQHAHTYPGAVAGLEQLRLRGLKLACLTNKPTDFAMALLRAKGLLGFFERVFGGDAFARKKPDPLPLLKTCEALGTLPARTLMVGDSSNDAQAARAAGCPVLLVTYGYNHGLPVRAVDADGRLDGLDELAAALPPASARQQAPRR